MNLKKTQKILDNWVTGEYLRKNNPHFAHYTDEQVATLDEVMADAKAQVLAQL